MNVVNMALPHEHRHEYAKKGIGYGLNALRKNPVSLKKAEAKNSKKKIWRLPPASKREISTDKANCKLHLNSLQINCHIF